MYRLEFNEVCSATAIDDVWTEKIGRMGQNEKFFCWGGLEICFSGKYYAIVKGKIPLEVAEIIYSKYPENEYKIRVQGGREENIPSDWAIEDIISGEEYIEEYHIDTKEGLLIFITEMKDYFARKNKLPETEVKNYEELLKTINTSLLEKINPRIAAYDWMQLHPTEKDKYNKSCEKIEETSIGRDFKKLLNDFDKAVNPFLNGDVKYTDFDSTKLLLSAKVWDEQRKDITIENCCEMFISSNTGGETIYTRDEGGFFFCVDYMLDSDRVFTYKHYYTNKGNSDEQKGEVIEIDIYDNKKNDYDAVLMINMTNWMEQEDYGKKLPKSSEHIAYAYEQLQEAIKYATSITIDNMTKQNVKEKGQD